MSPKKKRNKPLKYTYDNCDIITINTIIRQFYLKGVFPSINDVFKQVNENENISFKNCSLRTFYRLIKKMEFKYVTSVKLSRKILIQRSDIVVLRRQYLRKKRDLERQFPNSLTLFLDETFVHQNLINGKLLVNSNELPPIKIPTGKGKRFIILNSGSKIG